MDIVLYLIAAALIGVGLAGAVVPALPGIPMIFGGLWIIAAIDGYHRLGGWWLAALAVLGGVGLILDIAAGAMGAKRVGASPRAVWGALAGTLIGLFFGLPGLLFGPFCGAMAGELSAGNSVLRSTRVGVGTWLGLLFGTLVKLVCSVMMVAIAAAVWW